MSDDYTVEKDKIIYNVSVGEHINYVIKNMLDISHQYHKPCVSTFNDRPLETKPYDSYNSMLQRWNDESERLQKEYESSPAGIEAKRKQIEYRQTQEKMIQSLMNNLPNFNALEEIITWLDKIVECDFVLNCDIIRIFADNGFYPNVNLGTDCNIEDKESYARYLIGQALDCLQTMGAIHPIYSKFAEDWKNKFMGDKRDD